MKKLLLFLIFISIFVNSFGQWIDKQTVDEYGDNVGFHYINQLVDGNFSDISGQKNHLQVRSIVTQIDIDSSYDIGFRIYEYGIDNFEYKCEYGFLESTLTITLHSKKQYTFDLVAYTNILYLNGDEKTLIDVLKYERYPIVCKIVCKSDGVNNTYHFKLSPVGFNQSFKRLSKYKNE